ncbi:MAG TPA: phosphatase PAP2 family protein [Solirubrobacteraceae bacterium]|nr:phosphatase PAP2 family protein [Solirubrobacteraceae bacterium]
MWGTLDSVVRRIFPSGWVDAVRQVLMFAAAYYAYRIVRGAVDAHPAAAFENARHLIGIEQSLHTFFEPSLQAWATSNSWLIDFASWMYVNSHFVITISALVFLYFFRNESFYFVRNMFMVAMGLALICYVVYPTAPPRFFPEWGFHDSVSEFTGIPQDSVIVNALVNPFAAVPSMHVAFSLLVGLPLARLVRPRPLKALWYAYPVLVTFVVMATGNHFWLDALLGAAVAGLSAYVAKSLLARARPHAWAFARASVEA